ncbi:MAG TPA: hypothetical protein VF184_02385, partial [Phycisphaeraceae bacterium]
SMPRSQAMLGWLALRRRMRSAPLPDVMHCWSAGALNLVNRCWPRLPRVLTLVEPPQPQEMPLLRRLLRYSAAPVRVITPRPSVAQGLRTVGVPADLVYTLPSVLAPAGLEPSASDRQAIRQSWGLDDSTHVVALLDAPPVGGDAVTAAMASGLAWESLAAKGSQPPLAVVVHPLQPRRMQVQVMFERLGKPFRIIQDARLACPWRMLAGCDAALTIGPAAGGLGVAWAQALGCPVVAEPTLDTLAQIGHEASGLIAADGRPRSLAYQLHRLLGDAVLAQQIRQTSTVVTRHRQGAMDQWRQTLADLYAQITEGHRPVWPPDAAARLAQAVGDWGKALAALWL